MRIARARAQFVARSSRCSGGRINNFSIARHTRFSSRAHRHPVAGISETKREGEGRKRNGRGAAGEGGGERREEARLYISNESALARSPASFSLPPDRQRGARGRPLLPVLIRIHYWYAAGYASLGTCVRPRASSLICRKSAANRATVREFLISAGRESPISRFHRARLAAKHALAAIYAIALLLPREHPPSRSPPSADVSNFFRKSDDRFLHFRSSIEASSNFFRDCAREPSSMQRSSSMRRRRIRTRPRVYLAWIFTARSHSRPPPRGEII